LCRPSALLVVKRKKRKKEKEEGEGYKYLRGKGQWIEREMKW
jgi:hypothetical protein